MKNCDAGNMAAMVANSPPGVTLSDTKEKKKAKQPR
jgi:hypothetical protein